LLRGQLREDGCQNALQAVGFMSFDLPEGLIVNSECVRAFACFLQRNRDGLTDESRA